MGEWGQCITHHICDCHQARLTAAEAKVVRLREALADIADYEFRMPEYRQLTEGSRHWVVRVCLANQLIRQRAIDALVETPVARERDERDG